MGRNNIDFIEILKDIRGKQLSKDLARNDESCIYGEIAKMYDELSPHLDEILAADDNAAAAIAAKNASEAALDEFKSIYHGARATPPTSGVSAGDIYFDISGSSGIMLVYDSGLGWIELNSAVNGTLNRAAYSCDEGQTEFNVTYDPGFVDVWLNGTKLRNGVDFTATSGSSVVLTQGASAGDYFEALSFGNFELDNSKGGQYLGTTENKAIGYFAKSTAENLVVTGDMNAFTVDSIEIEDGGSITIEDGGTFKVL